MLLILHAQTKSTCAIDLMYAYAHTPLVEKTIKRTRFSSGDKRFAFIRGKRVLLWKFNLES